MDASRKMPPWVKRTIIWFWLGGLGAFYAIGVLRALSTLVVLVVISLFLSFAIEPAVNRMETRGIRRGIGTGIVFVVIVALVGVFGAVVGVALATQIIEVVDKAPGYIDDLQTWLNDTVGIDIDLAAVKDEFVGGGGLQDMATSLADDVAAVGSTAVSVFLHVFTVALFTFCLVVEGPKLRRSLAGLLSERRAAVVIDVWALAMNKTGGYIYSRVLLATVSTAVHWGAFTLLGVPSPLALALWMGVVSQFIPGIGALVGAVPAVAFALLHDARTGLWALLVIAAYQMIENYVLAPRITARTMSVHAALAIGAVVAGSALLGVVGAVLSVPVAATAQAFISSWRAERAGAARSDNPPSQEPDQTHA
ncbi:MAG: AI-2E family transporter [bacterium]|nr:AI-2E family transporter [bacterium]